jgi:hypothetical protein
MPSFLPEIRIAQCSNGALIEEVPAGYSVHPSPRRAARGRSGELLFTALNLQARTALPGAELKRLSDLMAQVFFATPGSVTAALRAAFVTANAEVLPFSQAPALTASPGGTMVQLDAVCAVLRGGDLYFGCGGNIRVILLREGSVEVHPSAGDPPARPLGTSLNIDLRYGHSILSAATTVILSASPPQGWLTAVPAGLANLSLQAIGERMAHQCASQPGTFGSVLVRFTPEGAVDEAAASPRKKFSLFPQKKAGRGISSSAPRKAAAPFVLKPDSRTPAREAIPRTDAPHSPPDHMAPAPPPAAEKAGATLGQPPVRPPVYSQHDAAGERPALRSRPSAADSPSAAGPASRPERKTPAGPPLSARDALGAFGQSIRITLASAGEGIRSFLAGILPRGVLQDNERFTLPPPVLLATAIAIPLIILAVVAVVYFRKGYEMEFARLMEEARTEASVANAQTDPLEARAAWQQTFDLLQTASQYGSSEELATLQNHAVRMLDDFDGITPLEFKPAVAGGFSEDTQITALLAGDRELYALDGVHQRILRLLLGQGGYQLDDTFLCRAGEYPDITVDSLVDMVWIPDLAVGTQAPSSTRSGAIVALDRRGTVLYCPPGGKAMAGTLVAPRGGWSSPSSIDYYNGRLYVLDPEGNGFWRYGMTDGAGFDQTPTDYFSASHPSVTDAVDFVVASGEVFLLHADGHITRCQYDPLYQSEGVETAGGTLCQTLAYNDTRPGRSTGPRIADALLNRIHYNEPPEPTLFFLDPLGRGAFRFSLALNFISRYRVTIASEKHEATALAVGSDKVLYIAIGNQIYFAQTRTP